MYKGLYNLFPNNHIQAHKDQDYMKAIMAKIQAENSKTDPPKGTIMDIFPPYSAECVVGFQGKTDNCALGMADLTEFGTILGKPITYENLFTRLVQYSHSEHSPDILKASRDQRFTDMNNLGVQTNIIFSSSVDTDSKINYNSNPRTKTNNGYIYDPDTIDMSPGDGSVLSFSSLVAGIKWADEFQKGVKNSKPVTFVHVCSSYNQKQSIFQEGTKVVKNEYIGVDCVCKGTKSSRTDGSKCASHVGMVEDVKVVEFVLSSLMDGEPGQVGDRFAKMNDASLRAYEENCELFNKGF